MCLSGQAETVKRIFPLEHLGPSWPRHPFHRRMAKIDLGRRVCHRRKLCQGSEEQAPSRTALAKKHQRPGRGRARGSRVGRALDDSTVAAGGLLSHGGNHHVSSNSKRASFVLDQSSADETPSGYRRGGDQGVARCRSHDGPIGVGDIAPPCVRWVDREGSAVLGGPCCSCGARISRCSIALAGPRAELAKIH